MAFAPRLARICQRVTVGTLLKYREDQERARARGFGDILSTVLGA